MREDFKFGGKWLSHFGGIITQSSPIDIATRNITLKEIPGKSGSECIDNGYYNNVEFSRNIGFVNRSSNPQVMPELMFIDWLAYKQNGYYEFEDTNHPGFVTYAVVTNFNAIQKQLRRIHTATINFSRVPFWYSKAGLNPVVVEEYTDMLKGISLYNPYPEEARPIIKIKIYSSSTAISQTSFTLKINNKAYDFRNIPFTRTYDTLYIDCEKEQSCVINSSTNEIYKYVETPIPPPFKEGLNTFGLHHDWGLWAGTEIIPRWRRL